MRPRFSSSQRCFAAICVRARRAAGCSRRTRRNAGSAASPARAPPQDREAADLERGLLAQDLEVDFLARQRALDEHHLALGVACDAAALGVERIDAQLQLPERQELAPVRLAALLERAPHERELGLVALRGVAAAHELEAQVQEIGVERVGFAIVADRRDAAREIALPDRAAVHAELAREAAEAARARRAARRARLVDREHVHQVEWRSWKRLM